MLADVPLVAFAPATDMDRGLHFFGDTLGLNHVYGDNFAHVFDAHGTTLRVTQVQELTPHPFTILGWTVPDITAQVRALAAKGVTFERYEGMPQDDDGVWTTPARAKVAWFKDPDGNVLSLTQEPI